MPARYGDEIAAVQLAKVFGWTLEYSLRVVHDPFQYAIVSGVMDGINKANQK